MVEDGVCFVEDSGIPEPFLVMEMIFAGGGAEFFVGAAADWFGALVAGHGRYGWVSSTGGRILWG